MRFRIVKFCNLFGLSLLLGVACGTSWAQTATIEGRVRSVDGSIPPGPRVVLIDNENGLTRGPETIDAVSGKFEIKNVQEGTYVVVACAGRTYSPSRLTIQVREGRARAADLTLTVATQRTVFKGHVKTGNINVSALAYQCEVATMKSDARGNFKFDELPVPPDRYTAGVVILSGKLLQSNPFPVTVGGETEVALTFQGATGSETALLAVVVPVHRDLASAIAALNKQVKRSPELFSAPSPRLQTELFGAYQTNETAREAISTLSEHQRELPETTLERAALLAFALEDYRRAAEFVDTGLKASPGNKQLLAARGLIQYQQSLYPQALMSLQQATPSAPVADSNFRAALMGNEALVQWGLGQTGDAETSLSDSIALFRGDQAKQQQAYLLLTQADFYVDYGQPAKAHKMSEEALKLSATSRSDKQARIVEGRVHRLRAKVALFRGVMNEANQEIKRAIKIHQDESNLLELAQDKDVQADIEELIGMHKEALKTLQEAAALYKDTNYIKGQSENQWKRASVLLALNKFAEAEGLINAASIGFAQLNYKRGLGDCEALKGVLILRRANHQYVEGFDPNMTPQEKQALDKEFHSQARSGIEHFEKAIRTFREIGYKRGLAYAQDKLAINIISLSQQLSGEDLSRAELNSKEAAHTLDEIGDKRGQVVAHGNLGIVLRRSKKYELAQSRLERALEISKEIDFKLGIGRQLFNLGKLYYEKAFSEKNEEDLLKAKNYFLEAQKVFKETQAGADELKSIDDYLKNLAENLR